MSTNHYCYAKVVNSNIIFEICRDNEYTCGKAMHIACRYNWGDAEKCAIYCRDYYPTNKENSNQITNISETNINMGNKRKSKKKSTKKKRAANIANLPASKSSTAYSKRNRN